MTTTAPVKNETVRITLPPMPTRAANGNGNALDNAANKLYGTLVWRWPGLMRGENTSPINMRAHDQHIAILVNVVSALNNGISLTAISDKSAVIEQAATRGLEIFHDDAAISAEFDQVCQKATPILISHKSIAEQAMNRYMVLRIGEGGLDDTSEAKRKEYKQARDEVLCDTDEAREHVSLPIQGERAKRPAIGSARVQLRVQT